MQFYVKFPVLIKGLLSQLIKNTQTTKSMSTGWMWPVGHQVAASGRGTLYDCIPTPHIVK